MSDAAGAPLTNIAHSAADRPASAHVPVARGLRPVTLIALLAIFAAAGIFATWQWGAYPKRFGVVVPGQVFRSGELTPRSLENVATDHKLKTVLSLLDPDHPDSVAERTAAERLGLVWLNVPLQGDGSSSPADRDRIRAYLLDESHRPLLIHCAAGANRTGLACGMLRIHQDGWTVEQVLTEMREYSFDDLPKHENLRAALRDEFQRATETATPR